MNQLSLVVLLLACMGLVACGEDAPPEEPDPAPPQAEWTHVVGDGGAVYYLTGPQQARPPEGTFPPGTKVRIVSEHGSYVRMESETGQTAYVSAGDVGPVK